MPAKELENRKQLFLVLFSCLVFFFFTEVSYSQYPHPNFQNYTVDDGLPSSEVYHSMQDSKGYFYFPNTNLVLPNKTPMFHWGQATMQSALTHLVKELSELDSNYSERRNALGVN